MTRATGESGKAIVLVHEDAFWLGEVEAQPSLLRLSRGERHETVEPRVMQALVALAQANGMAIGHDELIARCWDGRVVGESAIHRVMSQIRHLADGIGAGAFRLENIPRVGYRLLVEGAAPADAATPAVTPPRPARQVRIYAVAGAAVAVLLLAAATWWPPPTQSPRSSPLLGNVPATLAVLPFRTISGQPDPMLELGMADTLIARLSDSHALRVYTLGTVQHLAGQHEDPRRIARELKADFVIDGAIQSRQKGRQVTANLSLADGSVLWSETFKADGGSIFELQHEIADAVASALALRLPAMTATALAPCDGADPDLYRLHMQARVLLSEPTPPRLDEAVGILEEVFARDPRCARALAGKAFAWRTKSIVADVDPRVAFRIANASIDQALAIDPELAEAHSERGWSLLWHGWDWTASEQSFKRAIALNPSLAEAHRGYAHLLSTLDQPVLALEQAELALQVDPGSGLSNVQRGQFLLGAGKMEEAMQQFEHTLQVRPDFWIALLFRGNMAMARGDTVKGIADLERAVENSHGSSIALASLGGALARTGQPDRSAAILRQLQQRANERYVPPSRVAGLALALGQRELALDLFEEAYRLRDLHLTFLGVRSSRDHPLRDEPRFIALLKKVDLYDPSIKARTESTALQDRGPERASGSTSD
jgi:TolB-like protein/tetratricopeptide (TPR) repeat protein/DNA-binding winged helix-turn-helix (wHTH) protein